MERWHHQDSEVAGETGECFNTRYAPTHSVAFEGFVPSKFGGYVTKFTLNKALQLIAWGGLTFDKESCSTVWHQRPPWSRVEGKS